MVKRIKRVKKRIESLKEEIDKHFLKLEEDIKKGDLNMGRYHFKELDKSLVFALEKKIEIMGESMEIAKEYRNRLEELGEGLG